MQWHVGFLSVGTQTETALLGRDRFGVKPLFYTHTGTGALCFSSEMKGLSMHLESLQAVPEIDFFFAKPFRYESRSRTVLSGISRLEPGSHATFSKRALQIRKWWNTLDHLVVPSQSYAEQVDQWRELFLDSVRIRMRADVSIGIALSGGLDSSSVLAAMTHIASQGGDFSSRLARDWQHGFCSSYPGSSLDESSWAQQAANSCGIPYESVVIDPVDSSWSLLSALAQVEDPYLTIPLPMLAPYKAIKERGISVTLDGNGADELFSGYGHLLKALACALTHGEFEEILAIDESTRTGVYSHKQRQITKRGLKAKLKLWLRRRFSPFRHLLQPSAPDEGNPELGLLLSGIHQHPRFQAMDVFSQSLYEIFHVTILPTLLRNYDRYYMASGLEIRMPFMD